MFCFTLFHNWMGSAQHLELHLLKANPSLQWHFFNSTMLSFKIYIYILHGAHTWCWYVIFSQGLNVKHKLKFEWSIRLEHSCTKIMCYVVKFLQLHVMHTKIKFVWKTLYAWWLCRYSPINSCKLRWIIFGK